MLFLNVQMLPLSICLWSIRRIKKECPSVAKKGIFKLLGGERNINMIKLYFHNKLNHKQF